MKIYLGDKDNNPIYIELDELKNVLLSGGPGGGKTVYFSRLIKELTSEYSQEEVKFIIYDSKGLDYHKFRDSKYLLFPITNDKKIDEFKSQLEELKGLSKEDKTKVIVIIDEIYMLSYHYKECEREIVKLMDNPNIHFFISSQRPNNLGKELTTAIENKISYWLFDEKESKAFIGVGGAQDLKMSGEVLTRINGKVEKLQQKPFDGKLYL